MKKSAKLAVIGGDFRQVCLAQLLQADGHQVTVSALDRHPFPPEICQADAPCFGLQTAQAVILPMPLVRDDDRLNAPLSNTSYHISAILRAISPETPVFGGAAPPSVLSDMQRSHLRFFDYLGREELAIRNAVPTAEGAIQLAMEELPITLQDARVLVVGNGRIGRILARKLAALGAVVSVSARSAKDFADIEAAGHLPLDTRALCGQLAHFDLVYNTVPAPVLGAAALAELPADCLVIDLASRPGGVDFAAAKQLGRRTIHALSLPGKVAPLTAARAIRDTIYTILREENLL